MIVVDNSVWIGVFRGHRTSQTDWLIRHIDDPKISITDLALCEILRGARLAGEFAEFKKDLSRFPVLEACGEQIALEAAERCAWLRARGVTIRSTIDCLVATLCLREGHELLHQDRDFAHFERMFGLKVITT